MPSILLAAIVEPRPAPSMTMPASASPRATCDGHRGRGIRVVDRLAGVRAQIVNRHAAAAEVLQDPLLQGHAGVIARDRDGSDLGFRCQRLDVAVVPVAHDRDPPLLQRVLRQRRDVSTRDQQHGAAVLERAGIGLRDHLKAFHAGESAMLLSRPIRAQQ